MKRLSLVLIVVFGALNAGRTGLLTTKSKLNPERHTASRLVQAIINEKSDAHTRHRAITLINKHELTEKDIQLLQEYRQKVEREFKEVTDNNALYPSPWFKILCWWCMPCVDKGKIKHEQEYMQEVSYLRQLLSDEKK